MDAEHQDPGVSDAHETARRRTGPLDFSASLFRRTAAALIARYLKEAEFVDQYRCLYADHVHLLRLLQICSQRLGQRGDSLKLWDYAQKVAKGQPRLSGPVPAIDKEAAALYLDQLTRFANQWGLKNLPTAPQWCRAAFLRAHVEAAALPSRRREQQEALILMLPKLVEGISIPAISPMPTWRPPAWSLMDQSWEEYSQAITALKDDILEEYEGLGWTVPSRLGRPRDPENVPRNAEILYRCLALRQPAKRIGPSMDLSRTTVQGVLNGKGGLKGLVALLGLVKPKPRYKVFGHAKYPPDK